MIPLNISAEESLSVTKVIKAVLKSYKGNIYTLDHIVRKLAHFFEFSILGIELCLLFRNKTHRFPKAIILGAVSAAIDETIQIFSGRGSTITDVLLDTSAVILVSVLFFTAGCLRPRKKT